MKVKVIDGVAVNVWDNLEELERRQFQALEVCRRMSMEPLWTNRIVQLAQSISWTHWQLVKKLPKAKIKEVIKTMMANGFPADIPYKNQPVQYEKDMQ